MRKLPEWNKLSKWTQKETENLNSPISIKEVKFAVTNFPKKETPGPKSFTGKLHRTFNKEIIPNLQKPFLKIEEKGTHPYSFYKASITLTLKPKT